MTTVYLALGSNVGDSRHYIKEATKLLGDVLTNIKQAPLYASKAVGYTDQPDFINTALSGQTELEPPDLLKSIKQIEAELGRTKTFRWGPREIDIDIIFYGNRVLNTPKLTVPHPEFRVRDFVLVPLNDLAAEFIDPLTKKTVGQLIKELSNDQKSVIKTIA